MQHTRVFGCSQFTRCIPLSKRKAKKNQAGLLWLYLEGGFNGGLRVWGGLYFEGLIHGGAYFRNFTVMSIVSQSNILKLSVF